MTNIKLARSITEDFLQIFNNYLRANWSLPTLTKLAELKKKLKQQLIESGEEDFINSFSKKPLSFFQDNDYSEESIAFWQAYAVLNGGKRLRPLLLWGAWSLYFAKPQEALSALKTSRAGEACLALMVALEYVHAYSLVHDDLPAMDNDAWRRGEPTLHILLGEAYALLIGDSLLNSALEICFSKKVLEHAKLQDAVLEFSKGIGRYGMILGQCLDLYFSCPNNKAKVDNLSFQIRRIQELKTGKLFFLALVLGEACAKSYFAEVGVSKKTQGHDEGRLDFTNFANNLGRFYQTQDDLFDTLNSLDDDSSQNQAITENNGLGQFEKTDLGKSRGKDQAQNKSTDVARFSMEKLKELQKEQFYALITELRSWQDASLNIDVLHLLLELIEKRKS